MPVTEEVRTNQQTWKDWLGSDEPEPEELFTRDEIVERANALIGPIGGKPVRGDDLALWERRGILPRGVRRRHGDAQYVLFPEWHARLARQVRQLQREGYSLDEIKPRIRNHARLMLAYGRTPIDEEISARYRNIQSPEQIMLWPVLVEELERLGRWWAHLQGDNVDRIEVHVIGTSGRATRYPLPIASHDE